MQCVASGITLAAGLQRGAIIEKVATLARDPLDELTSDGGLTIRDALGERQ